MASLLFWLYTTVELLGLVAFCMIVYLLRLKRNAGRSMVKLTCIGVWSILDASAFCFLLAMYSILHKSRVDQISLLISLLLFIASIYCFVHGLVQRNSIAENGIIIYGPFPHLLKWEDIRRFRVQGRRIYLEDQKGYASIDILNRDVNAVERALENKMGLKRSER